MSPRVSQGTPAEHPALLPFPCEQAAEPAPFQVTVTSHGCSPHHNEGSLETTPPSSCGQALTESAAWKPHGRGGRGSRPQETQLKVELKQISHSDSETSLPARDIRVPSPCLPSHTY